MSKIFKKIRNIIYKYLEVIYETELLGEENENAFFSVDENLFGHINSDQFWLPGIINNQTREFRIELTNSRPSASIKRFISKHVKKGNKSTQMVGRVTTILTIHNLVMKGIDTTTAEEILGLV